MNGIFIGPIKAILVWICLRLFPSVLVLRCNECGRVVDPANAAEHYGYFHPDKAIPDSGIEAANKLHIAQTKK